MNQDGHLIPMYSPETSLAELQQQVLQHIKFQIKTIRTGSITDPAPTPTSLPYKDSFPKQKCSFREGTGHLVTEQPSNKGTNKTPPKEC